MLNIIHLVLSVTAVSRIYRSPVSGHMHDLCTISIGGKQRPLHHHLHSSVRSIPPAVALRWRTHLMILESITAILVSRFLVELQAADRAAVRVGLDDALESSSNTMPSFISSLGAFVNPDLELETSLGCDGSRSEPQEEEGGAQECEIAEQ